MLPWTRPPYGYRLHPERPRDPTGVQIEPTEAAVVGTIFAAYLEPGASLQKVAYVLHEQHLCSPTGQVWWGWSTLRGILANPTYTGQIYAGRTRTRPPQIRRSATHPIGRPHDSLTPVPPQEWIAVAQIPALVSEEQFTLVQAKLAQNQSFASRHNTTTPYLLRALVSCGHCQLACTARHLKPRYAYYVCSGKAKPTHSHRETPCASRFIPAHQLDTLVWRPPRRWAPASASASPSGRSATKFGAEGAGKCSFAAGTLVATPHGGAQPIAKLTVGDQVLAYNTTTGQAEAEPIQHVWLNHDSDLVNVGLTASSAPTAAGAIAGAPATNRATASEHATAPAQRRWVPQRLVQAARAAKSATLVAAASVAVLVSVSAPVAPGALEPAVTTTTARVSVAQATETIHTTANYPWLTADRGWVEAGKLTAGERVVTLDGDAGGTTTSESAIVA